MRSLLRWAALPAALALSSTAAAAERASVTLVYVRKDSAGTRCPDEATFRGMVASRLGYDPFGEGATLALSVELQPRGSEIVGTLSMTGGRSENRGQRTLRADQNDCFDLAASMAVAAAVAVDPEAILTKGKPPPAAPPSPPPPSPPPPSSPSPPPQPRADTESRTALGARFDAGGVFSLGVTPGPTGGVRLGASLEVGSWSIGAEGAALLPSSRTSPFGTVSASVLHGSLVPCMHPRLGPNVLLDLCAVGSVGAMSSHADQVTVSTPARDLFATIGPRAAVTVMPWGAVGFSASFDLPIPLSRIHLQIEDGGQSRQVWASSSIGLVVGFSLVLRLR